MKVSNLPPTATIISPFEFTEKFPNDDYVKVRDAYREYKCLLANKIWAFDAYAGTFVLRLLRDILRDIGKLESEVLDEYDVLDECEASVAIYRKAIEAELLASQARDLVACIVTDKDRLLVVSDMLDDVVRSKKRISSMVMDKAALAKLDRPEQDI